MSVIVILILASLTLAVLFLAGFVWAVRSGQYEDTLTPSLRMLSSDEPAPAAPALPQRNQKPNRHEFNRATAREH